MNPATVVEPAPPTAPPSVVVADEPLYEIVDGQRVELPPMSVYANRIAFEVAHRVANFAETNDLGVAITETLFHLALPVDRNRRPDAAFVSYARWPKGRANPIRDNAWNVVPDLAVEVISPTDLAEDLIEKLGEYFQAGVRLAWVVYPSSRLVYVYDSLTSIRVLTAEGELDGGAVLPEFRLKIASLFPGAQGA